MSNDRQQAQDFDHLPPLLSAADAAELLGVSTRTLRSWTRSGRLSALRTSPTGSGRVRFRRSEIERFVASCEEPNPFRS